MTLTLPDTQETHALYALPALRVLLISAHREDYTRIGHLLTAVRNSRYELTWCQDRDLAQAAMTGAQHDVVLLDQAASGFESETRLLAAASQNNVSAPIILISDTLDRQLDQQAIKAGAADYLVKSQLDSRVLERAIRFALDRKATEMQLSRLAHYDALSGVPNRVLFKDRLERAIRRAERGQNGVALLFLDFDGFKAVNDTYGHDAGDRLIELIAERLTACMRKTDSVARLGGDEFTIVLEDVNSSADIINVAKKIIQTVGKPFPIMGNQIVAGCSIGIAVYPDSGTDFDTLLKHADLAMYQAKKTEGSAYKFYSEHMADGSSDQNQQEYELETASRSNQWRLYYQPCADLHSRKIVGFECLLRWQHPRNGLLKPDNFLASAEETGQIVPVGYWVIHEACQVLRKLDSLGHPNLLMSVNLSPRQLLDVGFASTVAQIIKQSGIEPERLQFEVKETELAENASRFAEAMIKVHEHGPSFVLDSFGTGMTSLQQLQKLPLSAVKIHGELLRDIEQHDDNRRIVTAMINLAKSLQLVVVANGAEAIEQVRFLKEHGCDTMQGHYFSEAIAFDSLCQLLNAKVLLAV